MDTSSNKAYFIGEGDDKQEAPSLMFAAGRKYRFDQSDPVQTLDISLKHLFTLPTTGWC